MPRSAEEAKKSVLDMRKKMLDGHPNPSKLFNIKHDRGGMVDVEFVVQYLVLSASCAHPELANNFGNILLLEMAARLGLVDNELMPAAVKAYRRYRALQHEIRLNSGEGVPLRVPHELVSDEKAAVLALWRSVFGTDDPQRGE